MSQLAGCDVTLLPSGEDDEKGIGGMVAGEALPITELLHESISPKICGLIEDP